ncbi:hypothetical protein ABK040_011704 [Willaertia magna]
MQNNNQQLSKFMNNDWMDTLFVDPFLVGDDRVVKEFSPNTDVSETDNEIKIICNVPGLGKEDIKIGVDEQHRVLTITGEIKKEIKEDNETYHCVERNVGSFYRSVSLPKTVDFDGIKATIEHGLLKIRVPKKIDSSKILTINVN